MQFPRGFIGLMQRNRHLLACKRLPSKTRPIRLQTSMRAPVGLAISITLSESLWTNNGAIPSLGDGCGKNIFSPGMLFPHQHMRLPIACVQAILLFPRMAIGFVVPAATTTSTRRSWIQRTPAILAPALAVASEVPNRPDEVPEFIGAKKQDDNDDILTLEELSLRFVDVLAHYRETKEMSHDDVCFAMLRTRLTDLKLNRCKLGKSSISGAGLGVFASRACCKGELITLFPGDALLVWNCGTVGDFSQGVGVLFGNHIVQRNATLATSAAARGYELKIGTRHSIVADPRLTEDAGYLGHMMNDGAMLQSSTNQMRSAYSKASYEAHNTIFEGVKDCHYAAIATRDIIAGEELFVSYGEGYWLSRLENAQVRSLLSTSKNKKNNNRGTSKKQKPRKATGAGFGQ